MELKFASVAPILLRGIVFCGSENFQNLAENHGLYIVRRFGQMSFRTHNSLLEGATELKFVSFCSSLDALSDGFRFR